MVAHPVSNRQMMAVGRVAEQWAAMNLTPANADSLPSGNAMGQGDICMMASKKNPAVYREGDMSSISLVFVRSNVPTNGKNMP